MKKALPIMFVALSLAAVVTPAKADTDFTFVFDSGRSYHHERGPRHHWRPHHRPHYRPIIYTAPVYAPPVIVTQPRTVVYHTTVAPEPLVANPASSVYTDARGRYCREYQSTGYVGGGRSSLYGTACMQPDGSWVVVD